MDMSNPTEWGSQEPINITSKQACPELRLIGNFAATPFSLDGEAYASTEGFWQSLRAPDPEERARIRALDGLAAKKAGEAYPYEEAVTYRGQEIAVGSPEHWVLMRRAVEAKFRANDRARAALLSTGNTPLVHQIGVDSKTIPGAVMASIWMEVRDLLRADLENPKANPASVKI